MAVTKGTPSTILVIFGITGDLAQHKLLPALAEIERAGQLPADFKLLGLSRRRLTASQVIPPTAGNLGKYLATMTMDMADQAHYRVLKQKLESIGSGFKTQPQIIFYFAVPPAAVLPIIRHLGIAKLNHRRVKLLLEKPFGVDLRSAEELVAMTSKSFSEDQIYRIDHYLAKEVAQNITVFLGSNALFRNVWSQQYIKKIEIWALEKIGIEGRDNFYEQTGALRDFVQNHLLQLAALTLMEHPSDVFDLEQLPKRRLLALNNLVPPSGAEFNSQVMRGQYKGYAEEVKNPGSLTETFVLLGLRSKDPRWQNMPIYLATGKRLDQKLTEIRVHFKNIGETEANLLVIRLQPQEGIELDLWVKEPGYKPKLQKKRLSFLFSQTFKHLPQAYEQVLVNAMEGSHSLFASSAEIVASWKILEPIQSRWSQQTDDLKIYEPGSSIEEILAKNAMKYN